MADAAREILDSAWSARRAAFELPEGAQREALASVRDDLTRAAGLLRSTDRTVDYAHALHLGAHVAMDVDDLEAAEAGWREAVELLRQAGEPLQLAHKLRHLGDLEMNRDALDAAGDHYAEALALYREHGDSADLSYVNAVRRVAVLAERRGDVDEARAYWTEARDRYAEVGVREGVEEAEGRLEELGG